MTWKLLNIKGKDCHLWHLYWMGALSGALEFLCLQCTYDLPQTVDRIKSIAPCPNYFSTRHHHHPSKSLCAFIMNHATDYPHTHYHPTAWSPDPNLYNPAPPSPPSIPSYPVRHSPSSDSSLTDRDISRRTLANSGLDVSAPEFVPSFALAHSPPSVQPAPLVQPIYTPQPYAGAIEQAPFGYGTEGDTYEPLSSSHLLRNLQMQNMSPTGVALTGGPDVEEEEEWRMKKAVETFDEEFPALGSGGWGTEVGRALGWESLQKERVVRETREKMARDWAKIFEEQVVLPSSEEVGITKEIGDVWVSTGKSVGELYTRLRAEAGEEARLRNRYFDRATAAFRKGDGAAARKLGILGREANERMKELHRRAADAIFEARNPIGMRGGRVVDLHGLHVSEALERLPRMLEGAEGEVRILTGTGHHTKGTGRARLRPAVRKWLSENGYVFEEVMDANEFVGSFRVEAAR